MTCEHPLYNDAAAEVVRIAYLDWTTTGLIPEDLHPRMQAFLLMLAEDGVPIANERIEKGALKAWLYGCFLGFLARGSNFRAAMEEGPQICLAVAEARLARSDQGDR